MTALEQRIGFVGGGAMAQAIAEGLLASGTVSPKVRDNTVLSEVEKLGWKYCQKPVAYRILLQGLMASAATTRTEQWWTSRSANVGMLGMKNVLAP